MEAGNRVCIWGEILQRVSRKGFVEGEGGFFFGSFGIRGKRSMISDSSWVLYLLVLCGAGAGAGAVYGGLVV